ncbi:hypothetical protein [Spongiactinospora sp. 9N601]|uniref:hypothetical protein n=1 Tax=Spongiactinospora sp. 9N601 TaxID=3375149 RepID=UPI0037B91E6B
MLLQPYYDGLIVRFPDPQDVKLILDLIGNIPPESHMYVLGSRPFSFIVSGLMQWHEDDKSSSDPSWFGHMLGTA